MPTQQRYHVNHLTINDILSKIQCNEIAIPDIQRPFVWDGTKVRNLIDSLYKGFPVGYIIIWKNPNVRTKDGTSTEGKRILIDGQQRIIALSTALLGKEVRNDSYQKIRHKISFNPVKETFDVFNAAIEKDSQWIPDISVLFPNNSVLQFLQQYLVKNPDANPESVFKALNKLLNITNNTIGTVELNDDLDIDTITEIFIRINSQGVPLSQADFVMSKIAADEKHKGFVLRKAIDYFCHAHKEPAFLSTIEENDPDFTVSEFMSQMNWLKHSTDKLYSPDYTDLLRVAFTSEFGRGKLQDLVKLLSGRNLETQTIVESVAEDTFSKLKIGVLSFMNKTNFEKFVMILRSAGFNNSKMITSSNAVNFAYILYLYGKKENTPQPLLEQYVRRWFAMSTLKGRYSGSPESKFDADRKKLESLGIKAFVNDNLELELPEIFWSDIMPKTNLANASARNPAFFAYEAAQIKEQDKGFLSKGIRICDMVNNHGDIHHFFPKAHLTRAGYPKGMYNQVANYVYTQCEINIAIGDTAPSNYIRLLIEQCHGGNLVYGGITDFDELKENFKANCIPLEILDNPDMSYEEFLERRRKLMAERIKNWFYSL